MKLILASNSPRRKEILLAFGYDFKVIASGYEEKAKMLTPKGTAKLFAYKKARNVYDELSEMEKENTIVLGADTIVTYGKKILGKPKNEFDAYGMLKTLSAKTHKVITGYAIIGKGVNVNKTETTEVTFNELSDELIDKYIKEKKPFDKAGSYGIQDGYPLTKGYRGSYNNIVGLPIERIIEEFKKLDLHF